MGVTVDPKLVGKQDKPEGLVRVLVCIPNEGHTHVEAYANRLINFMHLGKLEKEGELTKANPRFEFYFITMGRMLVQLAREEAAKAALECEADYLFMIDDDMICQDDLFERLYRHNVDLIAPLAFTRNYPHKPVLYSCLDGYDPVMKRDYFVNHVIMNYPKDSLVECDAVGFGAVLIKTWIFKKLEKPWFMSTCGTGEDILFCYKAKKIGARVFMDTSTKIGHLSHPIEVTEDYVEEVRKGLDPHHAKRYAEYKKYEHKVMLGE